MTEFMTDFITRNRRIISKNVDRGMSRVAEAMVPYGG
jgi:hypothetical protein